MIASYTSGGKYIPYEAYHMKVIMQNGLHSNRVVDRYIVSCQNHITSIINEAATLDDITRRLINGLFCCYVIIHEAPTNDMPDRFKTDDPTKRLNVDPLCTLKYRFALPVRLTTIQMISRMCHASVFTIDDHHYQIYALFPADVPEINLVRDIRINKDDPEALELIQLAIRSAYRLKTKPYLV